MSKTELLRRLSIRPHPLRDLLIGVGGSVAGIVVAVSSDGKSQLFFACGIAFAVVNALLMVLNGLSGLIAGDDWRKRQAALDACAPSTAFTHLPGAIWPLTNGALAEDKCPDCHGRGVKPDWERELFVPCGCGATIEKEDHPLLAMSPRQRPSSLAQRV